MRRWIPVLFALAVAAGCGGGGSSGPSAVPTTVPGTSPTPSSSSSAKPTTSPTTGPTASPTAQPTATATPYDAVPSWNGQTLSTDIEPTPTVNGTVNYNPVWGDTASGGQGAAFNNDLQCAPSMSNNYHIHIFVGIYVNGQEIVMPEGIGVIEPSSNGQQPPAEIVYATECFYYTHTHDSTGVVHVEDPNPNGTLITQPLHTLGDVFTVWGITVNSMQFGEFAGPVVVYTSGQTYRGGGNCSGTTPPPGTPLGNGTTPESDLSLWSGNPNTIPLYSHEVIWFYVGSGNPTSLPNVNWYEEC
jgi:hypothetical protein